ncbi:hypothetical protein [Caulobacter sp. UC70_42]|uniref:hypothetical protein n=1 Tax=Caulobacter sp. UC70_42 TaxID=3374551 RepID=UPI0037564DBF
MATPLERAAAGVTGPAQQFRRVDVRDHHAALLGRRRGEHGGQVDRETDLGRQIDGPDWHAPISEAARQHPGAFAQTVHGAVEADDGHRQGRGQVPPSGSSSRAGLRAAFRPGLGGLVEGFARRQI